MVNKKRVSQSKKLALLRALRKVTRVLVVLRRLLNLSNGPLTVAGAHAPRRSFPSPKKVSRQETVRSARGRAQNKSNVVMKILAAHAVWSVILARRGRCADQSDRVEARYPAARRAAPLSWWEAGCQNPRRPRLARVASPTDPHEA